MNGQLISFIIPVYNSQKYLAETLNSIIMQDCKDIEILMINDGSTDSSQEIIDRYIRNYSNIRGVSTPNRGVSAARNTGISMASGKNLAFIDSDDVLCKGALNNNLLNLLKEHSFDLIAQEYYLCTPDLKRGTNRLVTQEGLLSEKTPVLYKNSYHHLCSYLYRTELIRSNEVCFPEGIGHEEDKLFVFQAASKAENMYLLKNKWFLYRNHTDNVMHQSESVDYILKDNIHAWEWLRARWGQEYAQTCDSRIFSHMMAYIELATQKGVELNEINCNYNECKPFHDTLKNYDSFWKSQHSVQVYQAYTSSPEQFYDSYKTERIKMKLKSIVSGIPMIRDIYLYTKYKHDLSALNWK